MRNWSFRKKFVFGLVICLIAFFGFKIWSSLGSDSRVRPLGTNEILHLEIKGVIMNGKRFLTQLAKHKKDSSVKAIVIEINSPGGAVGPSQEIYSEILRAKKETGKPIVCVSTGLIASGGYYSALGCDKIVVAPGTMIGSIGVIMEFANLEKLYDWAKISRYTITSGKFKDSGAEYRPMRDDERQLFQSMINEVYQQFASTVAESRKLKTDFVAQYADGRVMTGASAVKLGFADMEGTFEDAVKLAAKIAGLKEDSYKIYRPKKERMGFTDFFFNNDDDDELNSIEEARSIFSSFKKISPAETIKDLMKTKYMNQPMYLMPGYWE